MGLIVVRVNAREPRWRCECCEERTPFYEGEESAYRAHVVACSRRNEERLRGESLRAKAPGLFDPFQCGDVEFEQWVRRFRGPLLEGRMKL